MNSPAVYLLYIGMFISVLTLYFDGFRGINRYLAAFIFLLAFHAFQNYLFLLSDYIILQAFFTGSFWELYYLVGPIAYFYVRGMLLDKITLKKWDYLHFLLFVGVSCGSLPYTLFTDFEAKKEVARIIVSGNWNDYQELKVNRFIPTYLNASLKGLQGIAYAIWCVILILKYRGRLSYGEERSTHRVVIRHWLIIFTVLYCSFVSVRTVVSLAIVLDFNRAAVFEFTSPARVVFNFCFAGLLGILLFFPKILYGLPVQHGQVPGKEPGMLPFPVETGDGQKEEPSKRSDRRDDFFSEDYTLKIERLLEQWVRENKYLEKDITLSILSVATGIPRHHLSYYFNYVIKESFIDWRNRMKIEHACKLMKEKAGARITLEGISQSCGFTTYATFHRLFKQITGVTPSEYLAGRTG